MVVDALLADGTVVAVRAVRPDDADRLVRFHDGLSSETTRLRFFAPHPRLSDHEVARFTNVDHHDREALVALAGDDIVGVARYDRQPASGGEVSTEAEVAFVVADAWQGRGVATLLLDHLGTRAREEGIEQFVADTLAENRRMIGVFLASGLEPVRRFQEGVIRLTMPLMPSPSALEAVDRREHVAEARSIARLLEPGSIAVVGASPRTGSVGHGLVRSLIDGGFCGPIYPVHPTADAIAGLTAYPTVSAIAEPVDVAIVAVAPAVVASVVEDCAAKGVHGLVVVSGGFAEAGGDGAQQQRDLVARARRSGMRVIGPNCVGVVNTDPNVSLNATFGAIRPIPGRVALASQSGAVGIAVLVAATDAGMGVSTFVSLGNKADVSGNDLLQYWEDDPRTDVVLFYLESFGNPARFARLARRIGRRKPIVAVKSGRTSAGRRAAGSHTAALAADDAAVDALLLHCGVLRVDSIDEQLDVANLLAHQPAPAGRRVAIVGNSGGPGIMAADACPAAGLTLADLRSGAQNPVDLLGDAGPDAYADSVAAVLGDDGVDAVIVIHAPTLVADADAVAAAVAGAADGSKPVAAVLVGRVRGVLHGTSTVPVFGSVEPAVAAIGHAAQHGEWRRRPERPNVQPEGIDRAAAVALVDDVLRATPEGQWLDPDEAVRLLASYGIDMSTTTFVRDRNAARAAARESGYPVALKAWGPDLVHKTEAGGVALGLRSDAAVQRAWNAMAGSIGTSMAGATVQPMASPGVEILAGAVRDAQFGALIVVGAGGTLAELLGDRAVRVAPLSPDDAREALSSLRIAPLLYGYRGSEPVDLDRLVDLLVRLSWLAHELPEVAELDLNPVIANAHTAAVVDVRIRVAPAPRVLDPDPRHLAPPRA